LDAFGRGKAFRNLPVFLESRDLYPQGLELPKFADELRAFVEAHSELRPVLREAALRRALELGSEADDDYLVSIFAPDFLHEFGLHPREIYAVMRWQW
jgi:hypothetical protein